jgi:hypothetical protein
MCCGCRLAVPGAFALDTLEQAWVASRRLWPCGGQLTIALVFWMVFADCMGELHPSIVLARIVSLFLVLSNG